MSEHPRGRPDWVSDDLFPFESHFAEVNGCRVHYVDEGEGLTLLMVHGNPTWSFLYRHLINGLSDRFRCVAFDHPGFGLSEAGTGYGYTFREHTDTALQFIEALGLKDVTMFVQDWGGPIGLQAALTNPDRYKGLIIGNTFAWPADQLTWKAMSRLVGGPAGRWWVGRTNMLAKSVAGSHKRTKLSSKEAAHYTAPYPTPEARRPHTIFLRELTAARPALQALEHELTRLSGLPALILWGDQDPFYSDADKTRIEGFFPNHETHLLENVGHFIQDDAPQEVVSTVRSWAT